MRLCTTVRSCYIRSIVVSLCIIPSSFWKRTLVEPVDVADRRRPVTYLIRQRNFSVTEWRAAVEVEQRLISDARVWHHVTHAHTRCVVDPEVLRAVAYTIVTIFRTCIAHARTTKTVRCA